MSKAQKDIAPWIISANDLTTGSVVYYDGETFMQDIASAKVYSDKKALLNTIELLSQRFDVVEPVYFGIIENSDGVTVRRLRERIRSLGPTIDYGEASHVSV